MEDFKPQPDNNMEQTAAVIATIDIQKYASAAKQPIRSGVVILTENQRAHIIKRRGQDFYNKYLPFFREIAEDPDYIFKDTSHENTAIASKTISVDGRHIHLVIRLSVIGDSSNRENSIITAILENDKRYRQRIRNQMILYKRE